jgi:hypothetical protein
MYKYVAIIESDERWYDLFSSIYNMPEVIDIDLVDWYEDNNGNK